MPLKLIPKSFLMIGKIQKLKPFLKKSSDNLAKVISVLAKFMQTADHFPEICNDSKCNFIGKPPNDRAIFALESIPKIVETVVKTSFDAVKKEDGTMQMAYTKNRGTVSCNAITLQEIELCCEPTLQNQQDLKKAFNRTDRKTVVQEAQRKFGAGKLIKSWFKNRTYRFDGPSGTLINGQNHNCGTPPGTLIGVEGFMLFIATATSMTGKNRKLLWAALYADDTSPLIKSSNVVDFQKALDWAVIWAREKGCEFHLTGKKGPTFTAYLKSGQIYPLEFDTLKLGDTPIVRDDQTTVLGLFRKTRPINCSIALASGTDCNQHSHGRMIDRYGYECAWDIPKLKRLAYRIQHVKFKLIPEFTRKLVAAYFCGITRFSAAILWLRSSEANMNQVRYYYCMAMAACLCLTTAEALNLSCCKNTSVTSSNNSYLLLLERTGLPSLEEMAMKDAVSITKQIALLRPEWYVNGTARQQEDAAKKNRLSLVGVQPHCLGTLIDGLLDLRNKFFEKYDVSNRLKRKKKDAIYIDFNRRVKKAIRLKESPKQLSRLKRQCKEEISIADSPVLKRYFLAREVLIEMSQSQKLD